MCPGFIDMNHKVRIEHRQQPFEIPAAQGRQKCTDKFALFAHQLSRRRLHPPPGGGRGSQAVLAASVDRPTSSAISSKDTANMSCNKSAIWSSSHTKILSSRMQ